jgi:hypothetical protein
MSAIEHKALMMMFRIQIMQLNLLERTFPSCEMSCGKSGCLGSFSKLERVILDELTGLVATRKRSVRAYQRLLAPTSRTPKA